MIQTVPIQLDKLLPTDRHIYVSNEAHNWYNKLHYMDKMQLQDMLINRVSKSYAKKGFPIISQSITDRKKHARRCGRTLEGYENLIDQLHKLGYIKIQGDVTHRTITFSHTHFDIKLK